MKFSYSVKNLRRLTSTPEIEIRPITILLGRNSAGKSTFLRSFPLLRQSVETKSSAPILWFGDYVDFGNFESSVAYKDLGREIEFSFQINDYQRDIARKFDRSNRYLQRHSKKIDIEALKVSYGVGASGNGTARKYISIKVPENDSNLHLGFDEFGSAADKILINEFNFSELIPNYMLYFRSDSLFSKPVFLREYEDENGEHQFIIEDRRSVLMSIIKKELNNVVDNRISNRRITAEALRIIRCDTLSNNNLKFLAKAGTKTFQNIYTDLLTNKRRKLKQRLEVICKAASLLDLLEAIGLDLSQFFESVEYIGPARARSERFYRQQELEVSDISPDGKNLSMFLASLNYSQRTNFSQWVNDNFGYGVTVHKTEGHISINLEQDGQSVNVVDTGYGVSQVLPVLAQIWWMQQPKDVDIPAMRFKSNLNVKTLAIEQPELHLHPAHQALLSDVLAKSLKSESNINKIFLVETHSEALVNRLGELIEQGELKETDVQVVIFSGSGKDLDPHAETATDVTVAEYDEVGVLKNWPYGFFNYS